jgi:hypothetical protein
MRGLSLGTKLLIMREKRKLCGDGPTATVPQPTDIISTEYTKCFFEAPPEDEQVMLETCRGLYYQ